MSKGLKIKNKLNELKVVSSFMFALIKPPRKQIIRMRYCLLSCKFGFKETS